MPQPSLCRTIQTWGSLSSCCLLSGVALEGASLRVILLESHLECASMADFSAIYQGDDASRGAFKNRRSLFSHKKGVHRDKFILVNFILSTAFFCLGKFGTR